MRDVESILKHYKNVGILGIARSGIAAATKLQKLGINVFLSDSRSMDDFNKSPFPLGKGGLLAKPAEGAWVATDRSQNIRTALMPSLQTEFGGHTDRLLENDLLIVSPGIPLTTPILVKAKERGISLWSEIELGYRLTHPDTKIIAVTGSNGKSTTASLIYHLLKEDGYDTILAGNIGDAYCSFDIETKHNFIVLEVSSFQLDLCHTFAPDVAVITNITPDHLDRYASLKDYARSKFSIFRNQSKSQAKVINFDDPITQEMLMNSKKLIHSSSLICFSMPSEMPVDTFNGNNFTTTAHHYKNTPPNVVYLNNSIFVWIPIARTYVEYIKNVKDLPLKGPHNIQNILAAILAVRLYADFYKIPQHIMSFKPLEHRLEPVAIINGIQFINDSKATNSDSTRYALQSFDSPIHLLFGGYDKHEDMSVLKPYMKNKIKKLYLIGDTAQALYDMFSKDIPAEIFTTFESAIKAAYKNATKGDIVLLSPAHASYDWFTDFEHRGREFKSIVHSIVGTPYMVSVSEEETP